MERFLRPSSLSISASVHDSNVDNAVLTYEQARELLTVLDNTRGVIENYVDILEEKAGITTKKKGKSWWGRNCFPERRRTLYKNITIITVGLQFLNLTVLTIIDAWPRRDEAEQKFWDASAPTMIILQLLNLILIVLASGRLAKQVFKHDVNGFFMAQSYLATILLFAGIYTVTYRLDGKSWRFVNEDLYGNPVQVFILYAKFLFYSISTATLCGSDNVLPVEWYNCIFAGFQMLLSFCYFASILGSAIGPETFLHKSSSRVTKSTKINNTNSNNNSDGNRETAMFYHSRSTDQSTRGAQRVGQYLSLNNSIEDSRNLENSSTVVDMMEKERSFEQTMSSIREIKGKAPRRQDGNTRTPRLSSAHSSQYYPSINVISSNHHSPDANSIFLATT